MSVTTIRNGGEAIVATRANAAAPSILRRIAAAIRELCRIRARERRIRRAEEELAALDDRLLMDIGIARSEIAAAIRSRMAADRAAGR